MTADVVVVGSAHLDLIARAARLPNAGESFLGSGYRCLPGGKAANQAIAAAQQGAATMLVARVGADAFGAVVRAALIGKGVDVTHVGADPRAATGICPVLMAENGDYASIIVPGAGAGLGNDAIEQAADAIKSCKVLMGQNEIDLDITTEAARMAKRSGATVMLNAAPAITADKAARSNIWESVDLLIVNQVEAESLSGVPVIDPGAAISAAARLRRQHAIGAVVVTLGPDGAAVVSADAREHVEGYCVPRVVDTIGAGDAFAGALAAALSRGEPLTLATKAAVAAGAVAVQREGAYDACPTLDEVRAMILFSSR